MGSRRRETCPWCGARLLVTSDNPSFKCSACQAVTDRTNFSAPLRGPTNQPPPPPPQSRFSGPPMNNNNAMMLSGGRNNFRPAGGPTYPRPAPQQGGGRIMNYGGGGGRAAVAATGYDDNFDDDDEDEISYGMNNMMSTPPPPPPQQRRQRPGMQGGGGRMGYGYDDGNMDDGQMGYAMRSPPPQQPMMRSPPPQPPAMMRSSPPPAMMRSSPPPMMMPRGRKRALVCGVNYRGRSYGVKGGINDANSIRLLLLRNFAFPPDSILMLTEDEGNLPTKANIRKGLRWLVQGCQPGDSLVFHFSGHGSRQKDYDQDEVDGFDETLCPLDFETEGMIIDDEINDTIVRPLPSGTVLHAVIDSCYSGTVLDLPFACRINRDGRYMWEIQKKSPYSRSKKTSGGKAICFSACNDHETSADTNAMSGNMSTGALTYSFVQAVQNEPGLSYGRLLNSMRLSIEAARPRGTGPTQEPQLTCSTKFDVYSKEFTF